MAKRQTKPRAEVDAAPQALCRCRIDQSGHTYEWRRHEDEPWKPVFPDETADWWVIHYWGHMANVSPPRPEYRIVAATRAGDELPDDDARVGKERMHAIRWAVYDQLDVAVKSLPRRDSDYWTTYAPIEDVAVDFVRRLGVPLQGVHARNPRALPDDDAVLALMRKARVNGGLSARTEDGHVFVEPLAVLAWLADLDPIQSNLCLPPETWYVVRGQDERLRPGRRERDGAIKRAGISENQWQLMVYLMRLKAGTREDRAPVLGRRRNAYATERDADEGRWLRPEAARWWLKKSTLILQEAVCLAVGYDPALIRRYIDPARDRIIHWVSCIDSTQQSDWRVGRGVEDALRAVAAKELEAHRLGDDVFVRPAEFIKWWGARGWPLCKTVEVEAAAIHAPADNPNRKLLKTKLAVSAWHEIECLVDGVQGLRVRRCGASGSGCEISWETLGLEKKGVLQNLMLHLAWGRKQLRHWGADSALNTRRKQVQRLNDALCAAFGIDTPLLVNEAGWTRANFHSMEEGTRFGKSNPSGEREGEEQDEIAEEFLERQLSVKNPFREEKF